MNSKIIKAIGAGSLILGMVALSGCFESSYPDYGYGGYGYGGPAYYSEPSPVIVRNYYPRDNDHREYRDRDDNNRREEHVVVNHDHDRDVHVRTDRDHDHDSH